LITSYGSDKPAQKKSLRKKIFNHKTSAGHKAAQEILKMQQPEKLKSLIIEHNTATCNVFRTAYVAKNDRPFTSNPDLLDLQQLNGVNVGRVLHSNVVCSEIIQHMRRSLLDCIITSKPPTAVLIGESTSFGKISSLIRSSSTIR